MRLRIGLLAALTAAALGTGTLVAPNAAYAVAGCQINYQITEEWAGGFNADIEIKNNGTEDVNGWTLYWVFPANQQVTTVWNVAGWTQSGKEVTTTNARHNAFVPIGGTAGIGLSGTWAGTNPEPTTFKVNTVVCTVV